jgi:spore germination protein GerM
VGLLILAACGERVGMAPETVQVSVVFTRDGRPATVPREVPRGEPLIGATLQALLGGPTAAERAAGFTSWFSPETAGSLRDVTVGGDGGVIVDFADLRPIIPGAGSAAGSEMLLWELNLTLLQFEAVRSIEYRIDGSCEAFWNFLQRECTVVHREDVESV